MVQEIICSSVHKLPASTFATNQLQAMQMTFFYFLPSMLLSGFLFPFRGMPIWAQTLGSAFPITHALRIIRGIFLKGIGFDAVWTDIWPMLIFIVFIGYCPQTLQGNHRLVALACIRMLSLSSV